MICAAWPDEQQIRNKLKSEGFWMR